MSVISFYDHPVFMHSTNCCLLFVCFSPPPSPPHPECNRTYYGNVGLTYDLELHRPKEDKIPYVCVLTFSAAGGQQGDIVQVGKYKVLHPHQTQQPHTVATVNGGPIESLSLITQPQAECNEQSVAPTTKPSNRRHTEAGYN